MTNRLIQFCRRGISSIEMIVAMGSGAVLMTGLSGVLVLSSRSLDIAIKAPENLALVGTPLGNLRKDIGQAISVEANGNLLRLTVPDRDGDGVDETIAYRLGTENGKSSLFRNDQPVLPDTKRVVFQSTNSSSEFNSGEGSAFAPSSGATAPNAEIISKVTGYGTALNVALPGYTQPGDVYLVGIAIDTVQGNITQASGWNIVEEKKANNGSAGGSGRSGRSGRSGGDDDDDDDGGGAPECQAGLYSFAATSAGYSKHQFAWTKYSNAYCWVMRISGADSGAPITSSGSGSGYYGGGSCPNVTSLSVNTPHSLSLQFVVAERDRLQKYRSGLTGYVDQIFGEANELDVTVSVRKHHEFTGTIDENTPMLLVAPGNWVNIGAVICSP